MISVVKVEERAFTCQTEDVVVQWCNPPTLQPEQAHKMGSILCRVLSLEGDDKRLALKTQLRFHLHHAKFSILMHDQWPIFLEAFLDS